jgi:PhzF family phenazine biosynthesis protein
MVGINSESLLHSLQPDMDKLAEISAEVGCNGYYVFTLHPENDVLVHGRMFAPAIGIQEDPVTGNANGPLGAYLVLLGAVIISFAETIRILMLMLVIGVFLLLGWLTTIPMF